ncbi:hypothetical protein SARC_06750 [Sphaeroforma arctica JP610]|uniref:Mitochondrial import inner membrane translocase subunit TIM50 n=1 Tax=Sphaeroforma arctica JP610 TaxID=667725 RepID=A0A0L0FW74_9EUKA|nr:hypothetical protein SARC_06750 [Sphaeroforma arctica JP610]KNC80909.1 hypothetical protein SARC_06750 [Sphaeroforma arctica JP610]|eukprot:XP_014154811.1 hypothetical protein SARC_06750 [Sphaeroforma arctica JP610]
MARTKRRAQKSTGNDKPYNLRNGSSYYHGDGDKNSKRTKISSRSDDEEAPDRGSDVRARHSETTRESRKTASSTSEFKIPKKTRVADRSGEIEGYTNHTNRYVRHTSSERYGGTGNRDRDHIASTSNFNDGDRYNNSGGDRYNNIGGGWYNNSDGDRYGTNGADRYNNTDSDRYYSTGRDRYNNIAGDKYNSPGRDIHNATGSDRYSDTREDGYYNTGGDRYNNAGIRKRAREDRGADHRRRQSHRTRNHSPDEQSPEPRGRGYDRGVVDSTVRKSINTSEKGNLTSQNNSHQNINSETDHNLDAIELLGWAGHNPVLNHRLDSACGMKLVVLDLNGLLVHRTRGQNFSTHPNHKFIKNLQGKPQGVLIRPYVVEFIDFLFTHFHVAVWSSMMDKNVRSIMEVVFRPEDLKRVYFLLHQGSCDVAKHPENKHKPLLIKDLHKVWRADVHFTKENTLLIDDSKLKARRNPSNLLFNPEEWVGDMEDTALSPEGGYIYTWMDGFSKWTGSVADYVKDQEKKGNWGRLDE